jgi:hypothetical protein
MSDNNVVTEFKFAADQSNVPQKHRLFFYKTSVPLKSMMGFERAAVMAMCELKYTNFNRVFKAHLWL